MHLASKLCLWRENHYGSTISPEGTLAKDLESGRMQGHASDEVESQIRTRLSNDSAIRGVCLCHSYQCVKVRDSCWRAKGREIVLVEPLMEI
jgi:hypothetical protein